MPVDLAQQQWHKLGKYSVVAPTFNTDLGDRDLFTYCHYTYCSSSCEASEKRMTLKRKRNSTDDEVCILFIFPFSVDESFVCNLPNIIVVGEYATGEDLIGT